SLAELVTVRPGAEAALAAALGGLAEGVAVSSADPAVAALELLKSRRGGQAGGLIGASLGGGGAERERPPLPARARGAGEVAGAPAELRDVLGALLGDVVVVDDLALARRVVAELAAVLPAVRAVTTEGDVFGAGWAHGGSADKQSAIEVQAAIEEAAEAAA